MIIDNNIKQELLRLAEDSYPYECCAALFSGKEGRIDSFHALSNKLQSNDRYMADPLELYECEREYEAKGFRIVGFFHSHPDKPAVMSEEDASLALPDMLYLIASVTADGCSELKLWRMTT